MAGSFTLCDRNFNLHGLHKIKTNTLFLFANSLKIHYYNVGFQNIRDKDKVQTQCIRKIRLCICLIELESLYISLV